MFGWCTQPQPNGALSRVRRPKSRATSQARSRRPRMRGTCSRSCRWVRHVVARARCAPSASRGTGAINCTRCTGPGDVAERAAAASPQGALYHATAARTAMTTCRSFAQLGQNCKQPRLMRKMMKEAGAVLKAFVVVFRNNVDDLPLLTAGGSLGAAVKAPSSTIASAEWLRCADGTRRTQQRSRMQRTRVHRTT